MQEKEQQLEALRKQLEISAEEMEAQAAELEEIRSAAKGGPGMDYTRGVGGWVGWGEVGCVGLGALVG